MAKRYFSKDLVFNSVQDRNGKVIPWEALADQNGVAVFDDVTQKELVEDLDKMAGKVGGITAISEEQYAQKKRLGKWQPSVLPSDQQDIRIMPPVNGPPRRAADAAAAEPALPQPPEPPAFPLNRSAQKAVAAKPRVGKPKPIVSEPPAEAAAA